ncbi:MAG: carbohydrate kinase family protein [Candidatus Thorarchaeota archaeon]
MIACVGELILDIFFESDRWPEKNETLVISNPKSILSLGGPALNIAWYLQQMGADVQFIGLSGIDQSAFIESACRAEKIRSDKIIYFDGVTDTLISRTQLNTYRSFLVHNQLDKQAAERAMKQTRDIAWLVLCGSRHKELRLAHAMLAKERKKKQVIFCPSYAVTSYTGGTLDVILQNCEVLFGNFDEISYIIGKLGLDSAQGIAEEYGIAVVRTMGSQGVELCFSEGMLLAPAYETEVVSPFGAGDAFTAAFLQPLMLGSTMEESLTYGLALASLVVESQSLRIKIDKEEFSSRSKRIRNSVVFKDSSGIHP